MVEHAHYTHSTPLRTTVTKRLLPVLNYFSVDSGCDKLLLKVTQRPCPCRSAEGWSVMRKFQQDAHNSLQPWAWLCKGANCSRTPLYIWYFYLQSRNHLLSHLLGGHQVTGHFGVNDPVLLLPADDNGFLPVCCAAHLLLLTLSGQGSVGIRGYHSGN